MATLHRPAPAPVRAGEKEAQGTLILTAWMAVFWVCDLDLLFLSVTYTWKVPDPDVGLPETTPAPESFRPGRSAAEPTAKAHL